MVPDHQRTGKPRCGARDSLMKPCEELVAQARIVVYFADSEYDPLPREWLIGLLEKRKVLSHSYGPRSERLAVIAKIIDQLIEEKIVIEAPSARYYLWRDPRLQKEYDDELDREFGKPAA
ncbi:hypothetical protein BH10PAT4_BH10PAT4_2830 [soil metagenome]